ncbi:MAG TPA: hypothetical protein VF043_29495 [Ktedonobacteraceae bacterium]
MHRAAWPERLDEAALGPQGLPDRCACDPGEPQSDRQLSGRQHLGVRAANGADDIYWPGILQRGRQRMPGEAPGTDLAPRQARHLCGTVGHLHSLLLCERIPNFRPGFFAIESIT